MPQSFKTFERKFGQGIFTNSVTLEWNQEQLLEWIPMRLIENPG